MDKILTIIIFLIISSPAYASMSIYIGTKNTNAQFMLVDYNGNRTGYDPITQSLISETKLPSITYFIGNSDHPVYVLQGRYPVTMTPLNMKIVLTGAQLSSNIGVAVEIEETDSGLAFPQSTVLKGFMTILDVNQVSTYDVAYTPAQTFVFTKVAVPSDLIADITTAGKLNLVGNQLYINELIAKVNAIENARTQPTTAITGEDEHDDDKKLTPAQRAKKSYQKLLQEITDKYNKPEANEFVKQEAYNVLKDDLYI